MDNTPEKKTPTEQEKKQIQYPAWHNALIKVVKDVLEINYHTYKKQKVARL